MLSQSTDGACAYSKTSTSQGRYFEKLLSMVDIQEGWKILDIGCGTGNRTVILADKVGKSGRVTAVDPIEERIREARASCARENIEYSVARGQDIKKFGNDFDLVVAATVVHWIPFSVQVEMFSRVRECLKPGGMCLFNSIILHTLNYMKLLPLLEDDPLSSTITSSFYCRTEEEFVSLGRETGFGDVVVDKVSLSTPQPSLEAALKHFASSLHVVDYEMLLEKLRAIARNDDETKNLDFLLDAQNEYHHQNTYYLVKFVK